MNEVDVYNREDVQRKTFGLFICFTFEHEANKTVCSIFVNLVKNRKH